ncbi:hypothetical protein MMPV_002019 [Pyropia vietnamensis]
MAVSAEAAMTGVAGLRAEQAMLLGDLNARGLGGPYSTLVVLPGGTCIIGADKFGVASSVAVSGSRGSITAAALDGGGAADTDREKAAAAAAFASLLAAIGVYSMRAIAALVECVMAAAPAAAIAA